MIKRILSVACFAFFSLFASAQNETITNQSILDLLKEGFTSEEIIGAIENTSLRTITMDLGYLRELKAAGADATLTTYLQKIAKTDNGYEGVMLWNAAGGKPVKIYRATFEKESKGFNLGTVATIGAVAWGVGSIASGRHVGGGEAAAVAAGTGLLMTSGKDIKKLMIPGTTSKVKCSNSPVFRFFFNKKDNESFAKDGSNWYQVIMNGIESPNEFQVVKMTVKEKKNGSGRRIFPEGMSYSVAGFEGSNASNRNIVSFNMEALTNNTFEVTFAQPLEPGEYCFFYKGGLNNDAFKAHPFCFDFTVE